PSGCHTKASAAANSVVADAVGANRSNAPAIRARSAPSPLRAWAFSVPARAALLGGFFRAGDFVIFAPTCGLPLAGQASGGKPRSGERLMRGQSGLSPRCN